MVEFSENALYYTFSTIAQTLAGAIALLAAFVLYRLSILNREMDFNGAFLAEGINTDEARTINGEGRYQELLDLATVLNNAGRPTEFRRLKILLPYRSSLIRLFVFSFSISAIVIFASVLFIPFAPKQHNTDFIALVAWMLLAGFAGCMLSFALLIRKSLRFVRQEPRCAGLGSAPIRNAK